MNPITSLIRKLRAYLRDVDSSREDLADGLSEHAALPPIPPGDGKRYQ